MRKLFNSSTFNKIDIPKESEEYYNNIVAECKKYGIPTGVFTSNNIYTDYEREALSLIQLGKQVPAELKQKLLDTLDIRREKHSDIINNEHIEMSDDLVESILGIKLD